MNELLALADRVDRAARVVIATEAFYGSTDAAIAAGKKKARILYQRLAREYSDAVCAHMDSK